MIERRAKAAKKRAKRVPVVTKRVDDVRFVTTYTMFPVIKLPPEVWWVNPVLGGLFWAEGLTAPGYDSIEFGVVRKLEQIDIVDQTYCVFDPAAVKRKGARGRVEAFIAALEAGMAPLVKRDRLDAAIVKRCFQRLRVEREQVKLFFTETKNARGRARITYQVGRKGIHRFALEVECAQGVATVDLGESDYRRACYRFAAQLTKFGVRIKARTSDEAKRWLKGLPTLLEFPFSELFPEPAPARPKPKRR